MPDTLMFESFYRAYEEYQLLIFANKQGFYNTYFSFSSLDILHNFLISTFLNQVKVVNKDIFVKNRKPRASFFVSSTLSGVLIVQGGCPSKLCTTSLLLVL